MKLAITGVRKGTSKKSGIEYTFLSGVSAKGKAVQAILDPGQVEDVEIVVPTKAQLDELFAILPQLEVEFDETGRIESVSEVE